MDKQLKIKVSGDCYSKSKVKLGYIIVRSKA